MRYSICSIHNFLIIATNPRLLKKELHYFMFWLKRDEYRQKVLQVTHFEIKDDLGSYRISDEGNRGNACVLQPEQN